VISILSIYLYGCQKSKTNTEPTYSDVLTVTIEVNQLYVLENTGESDAYIYLKGYGDPYNVYVYNFLSHQFDQSNDSNIKLIESKDKNYIHLKKIDSRANDTTKIQFDRSIKITAIDEVPDDSITAVDFDLSAKYRLTNNTDQDVYLTFNGMFIEITDDIQNRTYFRPEHWEYDLQKGLEKILLIQSNESFEFKLRIYDRSETGELNVKESIVSFYLIDGLTIEKITD